MSETSVTLPDIARLYGVLVDDLFRPSPKGYANNTLRLLAVFERTRKREDFIAAAEEFDRLLREGTAAADDWRSCGVAHEYMTYLCRDRALACYDRAMALARDDDPEMYHRTLRQKTLLRSRTGQGEQCIAEQQAIVDANPQFAEAWEDLVHALSCGDQPERTLAACEEGLVRFPESAMLHLFAGDACRELKRFSDAFCHEELHQYAQAAATWDRIAAKLESQGLEIEAQWPREMAEKARANANARPFLPYLTSYIIPLPTSFLKHYLCSFQGTAHTPACSLRLPGRRVSP